MTQQDLSGFATNPKRTRCEIWTRVMGYHRPVSQYNKGKKSEFYSREYFQEQVAENSKFCNDFSL
jgi:hypothetical protein